MFYINETSHNFLINAPIETSKLRLLEESERILLAKNKIPVDRLDGFYNALRVTTPAYIPTPVMFNTFYSYTTP